MKKLMTMLAAVGMAFGLFADVLDGSTGTSFEGATAGTTLEDALTSIKELPNGTAGSAAALWGGLSNVVTIAAYESGHYTLSRAWQFNVNEGGIDTGWANYLNLAGGSDLTRYLNTTKEGHSVLTGKIYFDSLVKLTAFDEVPAAEDNAKIMVWLQDSSEMTPKGGTNLWVRINGDDYDCGDAENLLDTWARVTVKALPINDTKIGFVVFVDQQLQSSVDLDYTDLNLNAIAQDYANKKALFPLTAQGATTQITSVGFKGTGAIDEIVFSTTDPFDNAVDANVIKVVLNTTYAVQVSSNGTDWVNAPANFNLAQLKDGYVYFKGDVNHCDGFVDASDAAAGDIIEIGNSDVPEAMAKFNGVNYASAQDAADAATEEGTLLLLDNADAIMLAEPAVDDYTVTIDLGDNELLGKAGASTIDAGVTIVVSNGIVTAASGQNAIYSSVGCTIMGGTFNGVIDGEGIALRGGFFSDKPEVADLGDKVWCTEAEKIGGYWWLKEPPAEVSFTVQAGQNSIAVVKVNDAVVDPAPATLTEGDIYEVTFTADPGYKFADDAPYVFKGTAEKSAIAIQGPDAALIVAEIGSAKFTSLADAVAVAGSGDTIALVTNYSFACATEKVLFKDGVTFDLAGYTLTVDVAKNSKSFGTAAAATVTLTNSLPATGAINMSSADYGFAVQGGTLNVACCIELTSSKADPVFDIYGGTVNCGAAADITAAADIFRFKDNNLESTVNVTGGEYATSRTNNDCCIFHLYKAGHTANINITGGEFTFGNYLIDAYQQSGTDAPVLNFTALGAGNAARFSKQVLVSPITGTIIEEKDVLAAGCEVVEDKEKPGFFKVATKAGPDWPDLPAEFPADADDAVKAKYADWAKAYDVKDATGLSDAFLLNVDPAQAVPELKITSIEVADDVATITVSAAGADLATVNGVLFLEKSNDLKTWTSYQKPLEDQIESGVWTVVVEDAPFMKAKVGFKDPAPIE